METVAIDAGRHCTIVLGVRRSCLLLACCSGLCLGIAWSDGGGLLVPNDIYMTYY